MARDCGLPSADQRKAFETKFKKKFQRRLRERHRIVHAHEPASLESRIISTFGGTSPLAPEDIEKMLGGIMGNALEELRKKGSVGPDTEGLDYEAIEAIHEQGAIREARLMLKLVGDALLETFDEFRSKKG